MISFFVGRTLIQSYKHMAKTSHERKMAKRTIDRKPEAQKPGQERQK